MLPNPERPQSDVAQPGSTREMDPGSQQARPETCGIDALEALRLGRLQSMLGDVLASNSFYRRKLHEAGVRHAADVRSLSDLRRLPLTTKRELADDQRANPPFGTNLTFARDRYTRVHQTSGTTGQPLRWLDTPESWRWWERCWESVYDAAGVSSRDRIFFAFSFGPFIGFWSAFDGAQRLGALAVPGGGMSSHQRLASILSHECTVLVCTPTYALHLTEIAEQEGLDLTASAVRVTIHAGEPGASVPATKRRIEAAWGARCYDHAGATEVGAWGFECEAQRGLHVNEGEFIVEVVDPASGRVLDASDGGATGAAREVGELVLTNLGRTGMPVLRYRTGDHVKLTREPCACGRSDVRLDGGVIGRVDDMLLVRGVNVFPSAIEDVVRRFDEVGEFAVELSRVAELDELEIRVEVRSGEPDAVTAAIARAMRSALGLRVGVRAVPAGTLPRFELKAKRVADRRGPARP